MNTKILAFYICLFMMFIGFTSCESDDSILKKSPEEVLLEKTKEFLNGPIVLSTKATMNGVDKTLLPDGCPTKFDFSWKEDGKMLLDLRNFSVGTMPFEITFRCACKMMKLSSWEKNEYRGPGWVKFLGKDGMVSSHGDEEADNQQGSGASVLGYFNADTKEINFIIDYNMMNVRTETFLQPIDTTRINRFEQEFAQFEKDLA